jgi:hypothetical protein
MESEVYRSEKINGGMVAIVVLIFSVVSGLIGFLLGGYLL